MRQRLLVTGAHGFVGSHVSRLLLSRGYDVLATVRTPRPERNIDGVSYAAMGLEDPEAPWLAALRSVDCVIHLAAHVHQMNPNGADAATYRRINVNGTRLLAECAVQAGVRRFIFLSSVKVQGEGIPGRAYNAADVPSPQDEYAKSKWEAEQALQDICRRSDMQLVVLRPPLIYGPGVRANFRRLMDLAHMGLPLPLGSVCNRRSLLGIWNLADFIALCVESDRVSGQSWLIADGQDLSTPHLLARLAFHLRRPSRLFRFPPRWLRAAGQLLGRGSEIDRLCDSLVVNSAPARDMLGWTPPVLLDDGLSLTAAAYLADRSR